MGKAYGCKRIFLKFFGSIFFGIIFPLFTGVFKDLPLVFDVGVSELVVLDAHFIDCGDDGDVVAFLVWV